MSYNECIGDKIPVNLGFATVNETTVIVIILSFFVLMFYREVRKLRGNLQHRQVAYELQELKESASPNRHGARHVPIAGRMNTRPLIMAAIQETKTEVTEHFAKRRFRDPKEGNEVTAS